MRLLRDGAGILRIGLIALGLAGCLDRRSDAARYADALAREDFDDARDDCAGIGPEDARDDCLLAIMEQHHRLSEADCAGIASQKWYAECMFLLAERQSKTGDLALALQTCERSRYARFCSWHLLQDQVQETLDLSMAQAEGRIVAFKDAKPIPDAPFQFWLTRFREQGASGTSVDEHECETLRDRGACYLAVEAHVRRTLDTLGRASLRTVCASEPGKRAMSKGQPSWKMGPVASRVEQRWVEERCR